MKKNEFIHFSILFLISTIVLTAWKPPAVQQNGAWKAPASADKTTNPLKGNVAAKEEGKKIYKQKCAICHGVKGKGDGLAAVSLTPRPANFSSEKVQSQSDGAIYWKLNEGRPPMASYKDLLSENEKWQLINYIRALK